MLRLNIGAGRSVKQPGQINADIFPGSNIDVVFDATRPWPFKDNSIAAIESVHMLEHLSDPFAFFREAHRVLAPSNMSNLHIRLPYGPSDAGIGDLTHLRQYVPVSFACFQPGYNDDVNNPQHDAWSSPFSVMAVFCVVDRAFRFLCWPIIRKWCIPYLRFFWGALTELHIYMRALKTSEDVRKWRELYTANLVPVGYMMCEHDYHGRFLKSGEPIRFKYFDNAHPTGYITGKKPCL